MEKLLILNPGSTSTKIAVFNDEEPEFVESIEHSIEETGKYDVIFDQYKFRLDTILECLEKHGVKLEDLTCIVSRGGLLPPVKAGAYKVNEDMVWQLQYNPNNEHPSNLGAPIAYELSKKLNIPAYVYNGITVDEMIPLTKIAGLKDMRRKALGHNLNMGAAARRWEKETGKVYEESNLVFAHMGGGITLSLHYQGQIIDFMSDEEGPFSPERSGGLPLFQVVDMCFSGKYDKRGVMNKVKRQGGLYDHLGTNDSRVVEKMIADGDEHAKLVYEAMALSVSKCIAQMATTACGKVDAIILIGGIAYSEMFTGMIKERVSYIAPVVVYPGENEMQSLALGGLRVLRGQEEAKDFVKVEGKL